MKLTKLVAICLLLDLPGPLVAIAAPVIVTQPSPQTVPVGYYTYGYQAPNYWYGR